MIINLAKSMVDIAWLLDAVAAVNLGPGGSWLCNVVFVKNAV